MSEIKTYTLTSKYKDKSGKVRIYKTSVKREVKKKTPYKKMIKDILAAYKTTNNQDQETLKEIYELLQKYEKL